MCLLCKPSLLLIRKCIIGRRGILILHTKVQKMKKKKLKTHESWIEVMRSLKTCSNCSFFNVYRRVQQVAISAWRDRAHVRYVPVVTNATQRQVPSQLVCHLSTHWMESWRVATVLPGPTAPIRQNPQW